MSVDLPSGWNGRIVLGAQGRPVLHIATFPLPANDDDFGEIAKESLSGMYVNVRSLDRTGSGQELPVSFSADDFAEPDPPIGWRQASRDVAVSDDAYSGVTYAAVRPPSTRNVAPLTYDDGRIVAEDPEQQRRLDRAWA